MSERTLASDLLQHVGERVTIAGWVHQVRSLSKVAFLLVRDRTGITQVVVEDETVRAQLAAVGVESVVEVDGSAVASSQASSGVELHDPTVRTVSPVTDTAPVDLRKPFSREQLPTLLDHAGVALRHPRRRAALEISAASIAGFRGALDGRGFTEIATPKIVASATESGADVFNIDYFGRRAFLAQSPQFYKQMMVGVFERVYEVGPVFRAEPHDTVRHLAQYLSLDVEMGFIESHRTVMATVRGVLAAMADAVRRRAPGAIELLEVEVPDVPAEIPEIDFHDAQVMLEGWTGERVVGEPDLSPAHERALGEWAQKTFGSAFLFVVGYPMAKRPFYTHPDPARPEFSNSFDLLFRGVELITGGQRLHRYDDYAAVLGRLGQPLEPLESYLECFRYGMPPHGGFAIGLERWVARLLDVPNVREVTLFPRDINRLTP
jgi:nondiscriminating aspartyl-tRNA synthetase